MKAQTVTITFFKYSGWSAKWWAIKQMRESPPLLSQLKGLNFFKLMGSGAGNGFSAIPDFSTYALLGVWESKEAAEESLHHSFVINPMKEKADRHFTVFMKPLKSKGHWDGINPFLSKEDSRSLGPVGVLTRASIARNRLFSFWKYVPRVSRRLREFDDGLYFSKGIGEVPLLEQATFSLWKSRETMVSYAYRGDTHRKMIRKTHELNWYSEEMFVEFVPTRIDDAWPELGLQQIPLVREIKSPQSTD